MKRNSVAEENRQDNALVILKFRGVDDGVRAPVDWSPVCEKHHDVVLSDVVRPGASAF